MEFPHRLYKFIPQKDPFRFVDEILEVDDDRISGFYRLKPDEYFYRGHFPGRAITPGVILGEVMVQIGLMCLGLYLIRDQLHDKVFTFALTSVDLEFMKPVFPGQKMRVDAEKEYFRMGKLKVSATMYNEKEEAVCKGKIAGIQSDFKLI